MRKYLLGWLFLLVNCPAFAENFTISGYMTDAQTGETLIQAAVFDRVSGKGTVTNLYGYYSLTLPAGPVNLIYTYVGYLPEERQFNLTANSLLSVQMNINNQLDEVVVVGHENADIGVRGTQMSTVEIPISQIKNLPTMLGENDVLKALQLMPGVKGGMEGTAGMYVRGGGPDENLILLDGVPVYNVEHAGGMFSVFNPDAIKNVTLYKGNFPARFGGRLSSVVDVRMKDGNENEIHGNASIGIVSSKLNLQGPIIKGKTTFNVSFRRTYSDLIVNTALLYMKNRKNIDADKLSCGYYFYDLNAKIAHKFSDRDKLYLSWYSGDDAIYARFKIADKNYDDEQEKQFLNATWKWGNVVSALRWNHVAGPKMFVNTTASFTNYRFYMDVGVEDMYKSSEMLLDQNVTLGYKSAIQDYTVKTDIDYTPLPNHSLKMGANYTYHIFRPGVSVMSMKITDEANTLAVDTAYGDEEVYSHEILLYAEDNMDLGDYVKLNAGFHFSGYAVGGHFYHSLQPRLGARVLLNDELSAKVGYACMTQYIHLLSNSSLSLPTDLWVPVTKQVKPMHSNQVSAGLFYNLHDKADLSAEAYYKTMDNLIEYKDGASFLGSTTGWEEKVVMGRGWSYGLELLAQKTYGKTTGWIGYTWSKAERLFDRPGQELNNGQPFPAKYDRRHDFNITAVHRLTDRIDVSGTWIYSTGNCATLALQEYEMNGNEYGYISSRNNYRYNDYHRLDLGFNFHKQKRHGTRTWSLSVYNVYNQKNPFLVYASTDYEYKNGEIIPKKELKQLTVFTFMPSLNYQFEF